MSMIRDFLYVRRCPLCNKAFVPISHAENMALEFYVKHFKNRKAK